MVVIDYWKILYCKNNGEVLEVFKLWPHTNVNTILLTLYQCVKQF